MTGSGVVQTLFDNNEWLRCCSDTTRAVTGGVSIVVSLKSQGLGIQPYGAVPVLSMPSSLKDTMQSTCTWNADTDLEEIAGVKAYN